MPFYFKTGVAEKLFLIYHIRGFLVSNIECL